MPDPTQPAPKARLIPGDDVDGWIVEKALPFPSPIAEYHSVRKGDSEGVLKYYQWKGLAREKVLGQWKELRHDGAVRLLDFGSFRDHFYEVTEAMPGGLAGSRAPWAEEKALELVRDLDTSLTAFHKAGIVHRNLRPSSLYLRTAQGLTPALGDLVTLTFQDSEDPQEKKLMALHGAGYPAPETYSGTVGSEADYYALGITLWELLTGAGAFEGQDPQAIIRQTIGGKTADVLLARPEAQGLSSRFQTLLRGLMNPVHETRWGHPEISVWAGQDGDFASAPATGGKSAQTLTIGPESWDQAFFDELGNGSEVHLKPGQYRGTVVLKSLIRLDSLDPKEPAVLFPEEVPAEKRGHAIVLSAPGKGHLGHLVFRGESFANQVLVRIEDGNWNIEHCQFKGAYDCALVSTGAGTDPLVRNCIIHGGNTGVLVEARSAGTFEHNEILDHIKNNIVVMGEGTSPRFRDNKVSDGRQCGFFLSKGAAGLYEENDIHGNTLANVLVRDSGTNPVFKNNQVHDGNRGGFYILEGAEGSYEGNDVYGNSTSNIEVKDSGTEPHFKVNRVHDGKQGGFSIYGKAAGTYEGNEVFCNALANVFVFQSGTDPVFNGNRVHDGKHAGFSIYGAASGIYEGNDIYGNAHANVIVFQPGTCPAFIDNKVHSGKQGGFFIHGGAAGNYEENEVFDNAMANVEVLDSGSNPVFKKNKIHSCLNEGLFVQNGAAGRFEGNEFNGNGFNTSGLKEAGPGYPSIRIKDRGTSPLFLGNRVIGFAASAFEISKGASGTYEGNIVLDLDKDNNFVFEKKWDIKFGTTPRRKNNNDN